MREAAVTHQLRVERGGREVLSGVSISVAAGRVTGLLGPSGSGKTTLLRSLVGVQRKVTGTVEVLGRPAGAPDLRTAVGYMTQAPSVYTDLTVEENLRYFAQVLRQPSARIDEVVAEVDLDAHRHHLVRDLSGGERARVSLATTLLGQPRVLVLDEPTVGLDPLLRRDLWSLFHRLAGRGAAVIVSSHVMDEAARCDDLLLLRNGALLYHGTPDHLQTTTGQRDLDDAFLALIGRS